MMEWGKPVLGGKSLPGDYHRHFRCTEERKGDRAAQRGLEGRSRAVPGRRGPVVRTLGTDLRLSAGRVSGSVTRSVISALPAHVGPLPGTPAASVHTAVCWSWAGLSQVHLDAALLTCVSLHPAPGLLQWLVIAVIQARSLGGESTLLPPSKR